MDLQLNGKTALVTGANRGTGEVIARQLAAEGVRVLVHSNNQGDSESVAAELPDAVAVWGNITNPVGSEQLIAAVQKHIQAPDILVNNYGEAGGGRWETATDDQWLAMYQKNVLSAMRLIRGFLPAMRKQSWGRIIQLGTIGSVQPNSIMPHYYASKGALATMTVSLAKEVAGSGITVNTVSPGLIHTAEVEAGYLQIGKKRGWGDTWEEVLPNILKEDFPNPVGRLASRDDVANAVLFLASGRSGFIHGQNVRVDGGAVRQV